jgi:rare lipoprotein A
VQEPVPRVEPRARQGNRSPYKVLGKSYHVLDSAAGYSERGVASWYGTKFNGRATSSGELYDMCVFSAAHKTLPLPSFVRVTNLDNGRSLIVRVNDRGPFHSGRIMDLSYAAAVRLGVDRSGTARVQLDAVGPGSEGESALRLATNDERRTSRANAASQANPASEDGQAMGRQGASTVQVGSFSAHANAVRLAERLSDSGITPIAIDRAEIDGQGLWRVRIGPVPVEALAGLLEKLRLLDLPHPRVLRQ